MIRTKRLLTVLATALAIVCVGNLISQPLRALGDPFNTDFVASFRVAALMIQNGNNQIYCTSCLQAFTYQLYGIHPASLNIFAYPPLVALAVLPMAWLSPVHGLAAFLAVDFLALLVASKWLARLTNYDQKFTLLILGVASLPAAQSLALGQVDPLILMVFVGGLLAIRMERWWLAGIFFGAALAKPQFVWLLPFALLGMRQWKVLVGMVGAFAVWLASSYLTVGGNGINQLLTDALPSASTQIPRTAGVSGLLYLVSGSDPVAAAFGIVFGLAAGALLIYFGDKLKQRPLDFLAIAALVGIATFPHSVPYTLIGAAPALVLWGQRNFNHAMVAAITLNIAYLVDLALPPHTSYAESAWIVTAAVVLLWSELRPAPTVSTQNA